jgi:hypothetical protein
MLVSERRLRPSPGLRPFVLEGCMMRLHHRTVIVAVFAAWPSVALACSCTWFFGSVQEAELRAAAAPVDLIVVGEVVAETTSSACRGRLGVQAPVYRTLKIGRILKGDAPSVIAIEVGAVTPTERGCSQSVTSCDVRPGVGARGVWALMRRDKDWQFAGVCTTDAVRRVAALDKAVLASEAGGEVDAVRRYEQSHR